MCGRSRSPYESPNNRRMKQPLSPDGSAREYATSREGPVSASPARRHWRMGPDTGLESATNGPRDAVTRHSATKCFRPMDAPPRGRIAQ